MKILIKFPTRDRVNKFFTVLDIYYNNINNLDLVEFCISIDDDDISMNNEEVLSRLDNYENLTTFIGSSKSKIEAINSDIDEFNDWDIVLLASDDMIPQVKGYDDILRENMIKYYPDTDGVLWFFDGYRRDLNTLCILGKKYYDRFGYIYHPGYKSFYCDNEFMIVADKLKKQTFIDQLIIRHEHPDVPQFRKEYDESYKKNQKYYPVDDAFFKLRQKNNFGLR